MKRTGTIANIFLALGLSLLSLLSFAEGTKQISPDSNKVASLQIAPSSKSGSGFNAFKEDRIYFHIGNHQEENFYFGAKWIVAGNLTNLTNVYYKIKDDAGVVIVGPTLFTSAITSNKQALNGPNISGSNPLGYNPLIFDPAKNGDFYIEIYQSSPASAGVANDITSNFIAPYFDFTVGTPTGTIKNGRVFCQKWAFIASNRSTNFSGNFTDKISHELYTYTVDQIVLKVKFDDIQPYGFTPAFNAFGVNASETNWNIGRKSIYSGTESPNLAGSFPTFLQEPDPIVYPSVSLAQAPTISGLITGCPGAYKIPFNSVVAGDVKFILDLNGVDGFQQNTKDRVIEVFNATIGENIAIWDGKDGTGVLVAQNTIVKTTVSMLRGRVNMPIFDAEINKNGFGVSVVRPSTVTNLRLFWDDSALQVVTGNGNNINNTTGPGIDNSINGQVSPGHAWNGPYGTLLITPPAPARNGGDSTASLGDDDFGNVRTINTWFWGLEEKSGVVNFRIPYCLSVSGKLLKDPDGMLNAKINGNGTNANGIYIIAVDSLGKVVSNASVGADGNFTLNGIDSGIYSIQVSKVAGIIGSPAPSIALKIGWNITGEGISDIGDNIVDGKTQVTLISSNVTGLFFGVKSAPISNNKSISVSNPEQNLKISLPQITGLDSLNGILGNTKKIVIKTLPSNGNIYYDGVLVNSNQIIANYDSTKLTVDPLFSGAGNVTFNYSFLDILDFGSIIPGIININVVANTIVVNPIVDTMNTPGDTLINNVLTGVTLDGGAPATPSNSTIDLNPNIPGIQDTLIVPNVGTYIYVPTTGELIFKPLGPLTSNPQPLIISLTNKSTGNTIGNVIQLTFIIPVKAKKDEKFGAVIGSYTEVNIIINDKLSNDSTAVPSNSRIDLNFSLLGSQDSLIVSSEGKYKYDSLSGFIRFTPDSGFISDPTIIKYSITDISSNLSDTTTIYLSYVPKAPIANNDESLKNAYNTVLTIPILTNDSTSIRTAANKDNVIIDLNKSLAGIQDSLIVPAIGKYKLNTNKLLVFTPIVGLNTQPGSITYMITDTLTLLKDSATVNITYMLPYRANDDSVSNVTPGQNALISILQNDYLSSDSIAIASKVNVDINLNAAGIQTSLLVPNQGLWTYNTSSGLLMFDPQSGFTISPSDIKYVAEDKESMLKDTATVKAIYKLRAPKAVNDTVSNNATQMAVVLNIIANDSLSDNSSVLANLVDIDLSVDLEGIQSTYLAGNEGTYSVNPSNGQLTFTPKPGFYENPTPLEYEIIEKLTGLKSKATIFITFLYNPKFELIKTTSFTGNPKSGDGIDYAFTVINTGNVPIKNLYILDSLISKDTIRLASTNILPGGSTVATKNYIFSNSDLKKGTFSNTATVFGTSPKSVKMFDVSDNGDPMMLGGSNPTVVNFLPLSEIDVSLTKILIGDCKRKIGEFATFNLTATRQDTLSASVDLVIKDSLGLHLGFVTANASLGSFNTTTKEWTITLAKGETATLTIQAKILTNLGGLTSSDAWVKSSSLPDKDSTPGNKITTEDDYASAFVSVPYTICTEKSKFALLSVASGQTSYKWFKDNIEIPGAITNTYTATAIGAYTTIINGNPCSNGSCCPIYVEESCPCPIEICIPFKITKLK